MTNISSCNYLTGGHETTTSLCPILGMRYAEEYRGLCPSHLQEPFGKTLNISFLGIPPYVIYKPKPVRGTSFLVSKILSKKFGFIPKFIPAKNIGRGSIKSHNETTCGFICGVRSN